MDAALSLPVLFGLIAVALAFDFLNGLHDAANSIATIVSTRVLRPQYAVAWAAFFNFIAFLFFGLHVAEYARHRHHRGRGGRSARGVRRADGRDPVEPDHLGLWHPVEQFARADRRPGRRRHREGRRQRHRLERPAADHRRDRGLAADRFSARDIAGAGAVVDFNAPDAVRGRPDVSASAIRLRLALFARPWRQRCAKDHGHHRRAALFAGPSRRRISTCRSGW